MFWSKIWFFLVAAIAAVALTLALLMPRPAERHTVTLEKKRLVRACTVTEILMRDFARTRIQLASDTARADTGLDDVLHSASRGDIVSGESYAAAKKILNQLDFGKKKKGDQEVPYRPDLVLALDTRGQVVARSGKDENIYGDSLAGYFLVDDALDGYQRDDLWVQNGQLYLMAAAPVITSRGQDWAGAVVIGEAVDKDFASQLAERLDVDLTFYAGGAAVATSDPVEMNRDVLAKAAALAGTPRGKDCTAQPPFSVSAGDKSYWVQIARLPGEAGQMGAFYAVHIPREKAVGFTATIGKVRKNDLSFKNFPWIPVGILFLLMIGVGLGLMVFETDRPLRKLARDSVQLAQGEAERLAEERHRGKFGSVARSVNIAIDKLHRETRAAKKDLDNLLGPMPEDAAALAGASALPVMGPGGPGPAPGQPPPPSEFRFSGGGGPGLGAPPPASPPPPVGPGAFDLGIPAPPGGPTHDQVPPPPVTLPPLGTGGGAAGKSSSSPARAKPPIPGQPSRGKAPPPRRLPTPNPGVGATMPLSIEDDILGGRGGMVRNEAPAQTGYTQPVDIEDDEETRVAGGARAPSPSLAGAADGEDGGQYRAIYDEFVALKQRCGENTSNLSFDRFLAKLRSNRDALIAKHGCKSVRFQVYMKDGKAALKASPIR